MLKLAIKDTHIIPQIRIEKKQKIAKVNKLLKKIIDFIQYVIKKSTKKMYQKQKKFNHFFIKKISIIIEKKYPVTKTILLTFDSVKYKLCLLLTDFHKAISFGWL